MLCAKCGNQVRDDASFCSRCGNAFINNEDTGSCVSGNSGSELSNVGQNIGQDNDSIVTSEPVLTQTSGEVFNTFNQSIQSEKPKKSRKKVIITIVVAVLLVWGIVASVIVKNVQNMKAEKEYYATLQRVKVSMLSSASDAEKAGNLTKSVWYNTIYEKYDTETDKYTRGYYGFHDDFNTSLAALFSDDDFTELLDGIKVDKAALAIDMKELKDYPEKYETEYEIVMGMYDSYLELTGIVLNPTGSLSTFSEKYNAARDAFIKNYEKSDALF